MTIFVGAMALDNSRIKNQRADIICCCKKIDDPETLVPREELVRKNFKKHYVPVLFHKLSKIAIIGITVCLIILGFFSCA